VRGLGPPMAGGWDSELWSVSCTLISHICILLVKYISVQVWKHATMFARGFGSLMAGPVLGVKGELCFRVSYTLLLGINLDMPQFRYGKHATVFARRLGPSRPRAGQSESENELLVSCVLYVAGRGWEVIV